MNANQNIKCYVKNLESALKDQEKLIEMMFVLMGEVAYNQLPGIQKEQVIKILNRTNRT